jgi:hypothetical protein
MPISGVEVNILSGNFVQAAAFTDSRGHYDIHSPPRKPATFTVCFRKDGYEAEQPLNVSTSEAFNMDTAKLH